MEGWLVVAALQKVYRYYGSTVCTQLQAIIMSLVTWHKLNTEQVINTKNLARAESWEISMIFKNSLHGLITRAIICSSLINISYKLWTLDWLQMRVSIVCWQCVGRSIQDSIDEVSLKQQLNNLFKLPL